MLQLPWKQKGSALESELMTVSSFSLLRNSRYVPSFSDAETKMNLEGKKPREAAAASDKRVRAKAKIWTGTGRK